MRQPATEILVIDCNPGERTGDSLEAILKLSDLPARLRREVVVDSAETTFDCERVRESDDASSVLIFLILPRQETRQRADLIQSIKAQHPDAPIIVITEDCDPMETIELLQHGAADFITPPLRTGDTLPRVWRWLEKLRNRDSLLDALREKVGLKQLVGQATNFLAEIRKIPLIAKCDNRVFIGGETGTGKEMCARAIHYLSPRSGKPFVPVNCGAIPVELVENELFGHERGAFTGANTTRAGLIEEAEAGTLFLDEIDSLPLMAQVKLLRFLQEKEYRQLGSSKVRHADVRVITATNKTLEEAVEKGSLRQDLYYRLNVVSIILPPLRERRQDIPVLVDHFLAKYANELHTEVKTISAGALEKLSFYGWPGNVRELEHTIERAVIFSHDALINEADIVLPEVSGRTAESFRQAKTNFVNKFEREYIQNLLISHGGNISKAAQAARKNRRAFWELIRKHHINVQAFKPVHE